LRQVVTRTTEVGLRGNLSGLRWNLGLFNAENKDDIIFVASGATGFGYFKNSDTRRRGLEFGLSGPLTDRLSVGINYTYVDATFRKTEELPGERNSSGVVCAGGTGSCITVRSGDKLPLIPAHQAKMFFDYKLTPSADLGADVIALSSMFVRGNENNQHQAGGAFLGGGETGAFAVLNLRASYQVTPMVSVFARVNNVFDREYSSAGQLGQRFVNSAGNFAGDNVSTTFFGPGAPRTGWVGLKIDLDRPTKSGRSADRD
jgi:outer membrane receptor protein involved in Fe transport